MKDIGEDHTAVSIDRKTAACVYVCISQKNNDVRDEHRGGRGRGSCAKRQGMRSKCNICIALFNDKIVLKEIIIVFVEMLVIYLPRFH